MVWEASSTTGNVKIKQNVIPENVSDRKRGEIMMVKTLSDVKTTGELSATYRYSNILVPVPYVPRA